MRFLEMSPPNLNEARESLGCVVRDTDRAKDIVGRMRDHVQKAPPRREPFDLNEALGEVIDMVRSAIAKNGIAVSTRLTEDLIPVWGDRVQPQQVVVNLILNAVEAMGTVEAGARELLISTELAPHRRPRGSTRFRAGHRSDASGAKRHSCWLRFAPIQSPH
jgi:signal transduction histidine kinase